MTKTSVKKLTKYLVLINQMGLKRLNVIFVNSLTTNTIMFNENCMNLQFTSSCLIAFSFLPSPELLNEVKTAVRSTKMIKQPGNVS
jgi:hypothetical protein